MGDGGSECIRLRYTERRDTQDETEIRKIVSELRKEERKGEKRKRDKYEERERWEM